MKTKSDTVKNVCKVVMLPVFVYLLFFICSGGAFGKPASLIMNLKQTLAPTLISFAMCSNMLCNRMDGEYVLVVYQGETVVTIFFQDLLLEMNLYNYGDVGHFWVKGYEYLRILEYRLAILSDKCEYLGEKATSDTERKLAKLVHFPPLNYTCYPAVPAKYIVPMEDPWNPTEEAMVVMEELVKEAGDKSLLWWLQRYRRYHGKRMSRWIARLLHREKHAAVVDLLNKKLAKEAENYPRRDFGEKFNQKYQNILKKAEKRKAELESNGQKVTLVREEPFAAARDSVDFKVYLMIWKEKQGDRVAEIEEF